MLEIDYREEHKEHEHVLLKKIMKRKKKKKRQERHLINLFCFDVFGYKERKRK